MTKRPTLPTRKRSHGLSRRAAVASLFALVPVASCTTLIGEVPPTIYDLRAPANIDVGRERSSRQILIAEPAAVRFYATDRIVVRDSGATLSYYPDALWGDALPQLFQARLAESLERTGRVRAVGRPGQGLLIDTRLVPEIRAFEVVIAESGQAVASVDVSIKVMNDANGRVLAGRTFVAEVTAASDSVEDGVEAINIAAEAALRDIVRFVLSTV
ncbi:MAG: ABC-type transport auxiliary lipoprotein family protein [Pseudomonadota bacterium]